MLWFLTAVIMHSIKVWISELSIYLLLHCQQYTPSKKILLTYSFANLEITRGVSSISKKKSSCKSKEFLGSAHKLHVSNVGSTKVHPLVYNRNRDLGSGWVCPRPSVADSSTQPLGLPALGLGWHVCNLGSGTNPPRTEVSIPIINQVMNLGGAHIRHLETYVMYCWKITNEMELQKFTNKINAVHTTARLFAFSQ